nr:LPD38 domain-containing protein [Neisseria lisongii]
MDYARLRQQQKAGSIAEQVVEAARERVLADYRPQPETATGFSDGLEENAAQRPNIAPVNQRAARPETVSLREQRAAATTDTGLVARGSEHDVVIGERTEPLQWEIREASDMGATVAKADNQYRDRNRAASEAQINSIAANLNYRRLNDSPEMDSGAPTLASDGKTVIGGNGRIAAIKQAYDNGTAGQYRADLTADAVRFGFTPEDLAQFKQPVLVRRLKNDVDIKEAAIASNEGGSMVMSALEQAKVDAGRLPDLSSFTFNDEGNLNTPENRHAIAHFVGNFPPNQRAALMTKDGLLSRQGVQRLENAMNYQALGDSEALGRVIESTAPQSRNVTKALAQASGTIAEARNDIARGDLHGLDIADDLMTAADLIEQIKAHGGDVGTYLAQMGLVADDVTPVARELLRFIDRNIRSPKKIRELIRNYYAELRALGNPKQADILGGNEDIGREQLLERARRNVEDDAAAETEFGNQGGNAAADGNAEADGAAAADFGLEAQSGNGKGDGGGVEENAGLNEDAEDSDGLTEDERAANGDLFSRADDGGTFKQNNDDIRFSLNEAEDSAFARAVDRVANGYKGSEKRFVQMGTTPDVLKMLGLPDTKVSLRESVLNKVMGGKHHLTAADMKQLPHQLNNPVAVMKSAAQASRDGYVVLTEIQEHGEPVIAALHVNRTANGLEVVNIASVYGKNLSGLQNMLNHDLLYWNKAKGLQTVRAFGLSLPSTFATDGANLSINIKTESDLTQYRKAKVGKAHLGKHDVRAATEKADKVKRHGEIEAAIRQALPQHADKVRVLSAGEAMPDYAADLISDGIEGWYHPKDGSINLVAENLTPERAVWVAWHELGHRGFANAGFTDYRNQLRRIGQNSHVSKIADKIMQGRDGAKIADRAAAERDVAVEEALAELYAAQQTGDWAALERSYGVAATPALKRSGRRLLAQIAETLKTAFNKLFGRRAGDSEVLSALAKLHRHIDVGRDGQDGGEPRFSRRPKEESLEKLRQAESIRISGRDIEPSDDLRQYKRNALEYGKALRGTYVNRDTGQAIELGAKGVKEVLQHDYKDPDHLQSIAAIPQIIENAVYIDTLPNDDKAKRPDINSYDYYLAGLKIGNDDYTVRAAIANSNMGERYYDHKLTDIEKGDLLSITQRITNPRIDNSSPLSDKGDLLSTAGITNPSFDNSSPLSDKGDLLSMTSRVSTTEIENSSPLSDFDDKRLLQILQDKNQAQSSQTDSENFKRWFGSSKVVDENGHPLVVYHGSNADFTVFDKAKIAVDNLGAGFYFSNEEIAGSYATRRKMERGGEEKTYAVYLKMENPLDFRNVTREQAVKANKLDLMASGFSEAQAQEEAVELVDDFVSDTDRFGEETDFAAALPDSHSEGMRRFIENEGIDGLIVPGRDKASGKDGVAYVVFEPSQIKSATDNNGGFSLDNPDIRFSRKSAEEVKAFSETGKLTSESSLVGDIWETLKADNEAAGRLKDKAEGTWDKVTEAVEDMLIQFTRWTESLPDEVADAPQRQRIEQSLRRAPNIRRSRNEYLMTQFFEPFGRELSKMAAKSGGEYSEAELQEMVGYWMSAKYAPTANRRLVERAEAAVDEARAALEKDDTPANKAALTRAENDLGRLKQAVAGKVEGKVAGGYSDPMASEVKANIEKLLGRADLEAAAKHIYGALDYGLDLRYQSGLIDEAMYREFKANRDYVPFTGEPDNPLGDSDNDVVTAGNGINQAKDKRMKGRVSLAENAVAAAMRSVSKATAYYAYNDFRNHLNAVYEDSVNHYQAMGHDLNEARHLTAEEIGIARSGRSPFSRTSDPVVFHRHNGQDVEFRLRPQVMKGLAGMNREDTPAFLKPIAQLTRLYARGVTQFTLQFAPINAVRDIWEKSENIRTREVFDRNGKRVDADKVGRGAVANFFTVMRTTKAAAKGNFDSADGKLLKDLLDLGGVSTYGTFFAKTEEDMLKKISSSHGLPLTALKKAVGWVERYNMMFDLMPSFALYKSLIENGVEAKAAAGLVLATTDFNKRGAKMGIVRSLYMFAQPTAIGGFNFIRQLGTRTGKIRFAGYMAAGLVLYAALRAMDDDDEGGNKLDQLGDVSRFIPIKVGDSYLKVPVGFGMPQAAWNMASNTARWIAGDITASEAFANMASHWAGAVVPVSPSEISAAKYPGAKALLTAAPTMLQPVVQNVLNRNAFGSQITKGYVREDMLKAEQSKTTTAQEWRDLALWLQRKTGIDMHPEQIQNLVNGYSVSLVREAVTMLIENPNRELLGRHTKTPLLNSIYSPGNEFAIQGRYYEAFDEAAAVYREYESRKRSGELGGWMDDEKRQVLAWYKRAKADESRVSRQQARASRLFKKGGLSDEKMQQVTLNTIGRRGEIQAKLLHEWRKREGLHTAEGN